MAGLRAAAGSLGFQDARTVLTNDNLIFSAGETDVDRVASDIEGVLAFLLGKPAAVLALSSADFVAAAQDNPFLSIYTNPSRLIVGFLGKRSTGRLSFL